MSLLSNLKTSTTIQDEKDVLGGTFTVLDSDIYTGTIKYAYLQQAQSSSAMSLNLCVEIDGKEYKETLWMTNKNGDNFYVAKDGNQNYLPGFTVANNIALFTCQKPLAELNTEDKILKLYNYEQKQEVPTQVPCITDMHGKDISLAIMKEVRPKQQKNDAGVYVDTTETREVNSIQKVFQLCRKLWKCMVETKRRVRVFPRTDPDDNQLYRSSKGHLQRPPVHYRCGWISRLSAY